MTASRPLALDPLPPETRRIDGRVAFQDAVREALELLAQRGDPDVVLCDADFADWPLGERRVITALEQWATSRRRLRVLARHYDEVVRRHPRWVAWRRTWAHVVECRVLPEGEAGPLPTVLLAASGPLTLRLHDPERFRGTWSTEPRDATEASELLDLLHPYTSEAFPATTLGL
jgi:CheY-like chemotaxis protein